MPTHSFAPVRSSKFNEWTFSVQATALSSIINARVPRIAYVSCNPVSYARDAARLISAGYSLDWVRVVDQFRWSTHVELVSQFTLAKS